MSKQLQATVCIHDPGAESNVSIGSELRCTLPWVVVVVSGTPRAHSLQNRNVKTEREAWVTTLAPQISSSGSSAESLGPEEEEQVDGADSLLSAAPYEPGFLNVPGTRTGSNAYIARQRVSERSSSLLLPTCLALCLGGLADEMELLLSFQARVNPVRFFEMFISSSPVAKEFMVEYHEQRLDTGSCNY